MSRIIVKTAQKPFELKPSKSMVKICMCGLSKTQPFCDTSHKKTQDEEKNHIYSYDEKGTRQDLTAGDEAATGCCGGNGEGGCCKDK